MRWSEEIVQAIENRDVNHVKQMLCGTKFSSSILFFYAARIPHNVSVLECLYKECTPLVNQSIHVVTQDLFKQTDIPILETGELNLIQEIHHLIFTMWPDYWTSTPQKTPLLEACAHQNWDNVLFFLEKKCELDTAVDSQGNTPLHYIAMGAPQHVLKTIQYDVKMNTVVFSTKMNWDDYLIHISDRFVHDKAMFQEFMTLCPRYHTSLKKFFLYTVQHNRLSHFKPAAHYFEDFCLTYRDAHFNNMIHLAIMAMDEKNTGDFLQNLMKRDRYQKTYLVFQMNNQGYTAFHLAVIHDKLQAVKILSKYYNTTEGFYYTGLTRDSPMTYAVLLDKTEILKYLFEAQQFVPQKWKEIRNMTPQLQKLYIKAYEKIMTNK